MRSGGGQRRWLNGGNRLDNLKPAKHRRRENIHAGTAIYQIIGDVGFAHVSGRSQSRLPVAAAPVPRGIEKSWLLLQKLFDAAKLLCATLTNSLTSSGLSESFLGMIGLDGYGGGPNGLKLSDRG